MPELEEPKPQTEKPEKEEPKYQIDPSVEPVVTDHAISFNGKGKLEYTATAGLMPIKSELGETEAGMFFMAYMAKGQKDKNRPLTFSFNGGPGSSSVWLHMGALGPKRVKLTQEGHAPKPPYQLVENPDSWLADTDLVFIDPIGTGYSRPIKKDDGKKYWGLQPDIESVGEFIRMYLSRYHRWSSPLFMVGESYGTTRAAGLASHLFDRGIAMNGIMLVSSILNFQTARFNKGNDLPYVLFLPTYTATAWYHKKLPADLQKNLKRTIAEVEQWAATEYTLALAKGDALQGADRQKIVEKLARYTGLSPEYVDNSDLRINIHNFCKELLRSDKRTVGRIDSRYIGIDARAVTENPDFDPSISATLAPYTSTINDYLGRELGYKTDMPYHVFNPGELWKHWEWGSAGEGHPDTSEALRAAMSKNAFMKIFVASGYYDLATPFFATKYTLDHLGLDPSLRGNITTADYEAGHMMYVHEDCLRKLKADVTAFIRSAL